VLDDAIVAHETSDDSISRENGASNANVIDLFPVGSLARVAIIPAHIDVRPGGERRVRAVAHDADGRVLHDELLFVWCCDAPFVEVRGEGARPAIVVASDAKLDAEAILHLRAERRGCVAQASATIRVAAADADTVARHLGVPEPRLVSDASGTWRSRMHGDRWDVNDAHEDWLAIRSDPRARVRYLLSLFAKEIVQRSFGKPGDDALLERMVEILAYAERNLRGVDAQPADGARRPSPRVAR
jgi:hypothetical protein